MICIQDVTDDSDEMRANCLQGPLQDMSEAELTHWMRCASLRTAATAAPGAAAILEKFGERRVHLSHSFKVLLSLRLVPDIT